MLVVFMMVDVIWLKGVVVIVENSDSDSDANPHTCRRLVDIHTGTEPLMIIFSTNCRIGLFR